ncbi:hypothetical protein C7410_12264 [Paraburkholderia silvatlantica]|uniref:CHAT domain-containing protein n=2 Tax=Paraburkholderia silvatlantica TaxID=321895 RepID=A0A2V4T3X7_9BURK|nr:hypothetical protein C7410_12264 [Paraburkholderia silvatlantica]
MSSFRFSKVAIIQSLDPGEFETGTELGQSIEGLRDDDVVVPEVELINVKGRDEFLHAVEKLTIEAQQSDIAPILQIEMHGWEDKSGLAFPDDSSLTWQELSDPFARLNKATGFNLLVCMSACFGGHSLSFVKPDGPSPCFGLIGPTHSVSPSELLGGFRSFYRELITTLDVNAALAKLHAHKLQEGGYINITAEQWFFWIADGYLKTYCTQERLQARAKAITDQIKNEGKALNDAQLAAVAQLGKTLATNFLNRRFPTFFMVDAIPENTARFGKSLTEAKQEVADFMAAKK